MDAERWKQIDALLDAVFQLEPDKRDAFLDNVCAGDESLRKELVTLVAADERGRSFLKGSALEEAAKPPSTPPPVFESGALVSNRYQIIAPIGAGGMGEVYRAQDRRLSRDVAIKVLPESLLSSPQLLARFEREARALAALSHPNILSIHDFGTDEGISYAVMELLKGETLRARVHRSPLSRKESVEIAIAIAEGLSAAHTAGIIHRDLKPENIFITSDDRVKILDFGLARRESKIAEEQVTSAPTETRQTTPGVVMGTVPYMSPEQVRGDPVDTRTDIFSFGCVLYEMISGRRPFIRETSPETMTAILKEDPPPLPQDVTPELQRIIFHCLEKKPQNRFQTMRDLIFDLKGISTTAEQQALSLQGGSKWKAIAATVLLVILAAGALLYVRYDSRSGIDSIAVLPFLNSSQDPDVDFLSDGITERIISSLSQLPQLRVMARSTVFSYKGKQVDPRIVGKELRVQAILMATMIQRGDQLTIRAELVNTDDGSQIWGEEFNRPLTDIILLQEELAKEISKSMRLKLTPEQTKELAKRPTQNAEAYQLYLKGRYYWNKRTHEGFVKAREYFQQALDKDPTYALAYAGLADYYSQPGYNFLPVNETIPKAFAAATKAMELDPTLAEPHVVMGLLLFQWKGDAAASEREYQKAIALNPNYPTAYQWYARGLSATGRKEEAVQRIKKALDLDPLSLSIQTSFGDILRDSREYEKAIQQYTKVIEMDPNFAQAYMNLGILYELRGMQEEAVKLQIRAMRVGKHPAFAESENLYKKYGWRGLWESELNEHMNALKNKEFVDTQRLVRIYLILGDREKAMEWAEKYYEQNKDNRTALYDIQFSPMFDPLRSDPRFLALLQAIGPKLR